MAEEGQKKYRAPAGYKNKVLEERNAPDNESVENNEGVHFNPDTGMFHPDDHEQMEFNPVTGIWQPKFQSGDQGDDNGSN